jgi:hypothetical protein
MNLISKDFNLAFHANMIISFHQYSSSTGTVFGQDYVYECDYFSCYLKNL